MNPIAPTLSRDVKTLCQWMAGDFSNRKQSDERPTDFAHIHVFFRPLPFDFFGAIGFYSEQAYDYDLWSPYRQGIHKVVDLGDRILIENYGMNDPMLYAGAARDTNILQSIKPEVIKARVGCSMVFRSEGADKFLGGVEPGNACIIPRDGVMTYLVSDVVVTDSTWWSLDRGFHPETNEHLWGSKLGPLMFEKVMSFAEELPFDRFN
jgi:CpeT protein